MRKAKEMNCKFETYKIIEIHRSKLKNAPYNPRTISEKAYKKLKSNLKKRGMMQPPIWNARTGNIISGHQRLSVLDSLMGTQDYMVKVAKVDLDEKTEKEQNIFINNPEAMGEWDLDKLDKLFSEIDLEESGFDIIDIHQLFGENPLYEKPTEEQPKQIFQQVKENLEKINNKTTDAYLIIVFKDYNEKKAFLETRGLPDTYVIDACLI